MRFDSEIELTRNLLALENSILDPHEAYRGHVLVGPYNLACIEKVRCLSAIDSLPQVGTDAFVLGLGRSENRTLTQFGSPPYLPASTRWPRHNGDPMRLLGQFNFSESKDILPPIPGDILVMFIADESCLADHRYYHFEWVSIGEYPLISAEECSMPRWPFKGCFGVRYRSFDVQDCSSVIREVSRAVPSMRSIEDDWEFYTPFSRLPGLKIGGLPHWVYPDSELDALAERERLLCSFGSIVPTEGHEYPWANREAPYTRGVPVSDRLNAFDCFQLYLFIDASGRVSIVDRSI